MCEQMNCNIPRPEHPRPDFMRDSFYNLNGAWEFAFDDGNIGLKEGWYKPGYKFDKTITVPFCYQSAASGQYFLNCISLSNSLPWSVLMATIEHPNLF